MLHTSLLRLITRSGYFTSSNFLALYCSAPFRKFSRMMSHNTVPFSDNYVNNDNNHPILPFKRRDKTVKIKQELNISDVYSAKAKLIIR